MKMIRQRVPAEVLELAQRGLNLLQLALKEADPKNESDKIGYEIFDITTLKGLLKGEVYTEFTKEEKESFVHKHGVDFPEYLGDELQPVEFTKVNKPKIEIEKIASIEVDRDTLEFFSGHGAMENDQAVFIMLETVETLHEEEMDENDELKELIEKILDDADEDVEYIHFWRA